MPGKAIGLIALCLSFKYCLKAIGSLNTLEPADFLCDALICFPRPRHWPCLLRDTNLKNQDVIKIKEWP